MILLECSRIQTAVVHAQGDIISVGAVQGSGDNLLQALVY
jgi:hypothetical protein